MFRLLLGHVVIGALIFCFGWLIYSIELGLYLAAWSLIIAPLLLPVVYWYGLRYAGSLHSFRFDGGQKDRISQLLLSKLLYLPRPRPELWVFKHGDRAILWFEWPFTRRQVIILTTALLRDGGGGAVESALSSIWDDIHRCSSIRRTIRSISIVLWLGALSPLAILLAVLKVLLWAMGLSGVPSPNFIFLRFSWFLQQKWIGRKDDRLEPSYLRRGPYQNVIPKLWFSVLWAPWFQVLDQAIHPLWRMWTHSEAFFGQSKDSSCIKIT